MVRTQLNEEQIQPTAFKLFRKVFASEGFPRPRKDCSLTFGGASFLW